jgi:C4-dicarboxylate transporter DctM subunit
MIIPILFGSFLALVIFSVPIGISLGMASVFSILMIRPISLESFAQAMMGGLDSFPLMAVPLFTLAGDIMGRGGISKRLIGVAEIFFGGMTGGLGVVAIVGCLFFAAISGTGSATVAAIGCIMLPSMVSKKYDLNFSGALIATSGTVGVIIPPSIPMVVYAIAAGVSVTGMFSAGIMPGILVGVVLSIYTIIIARRRGYKSIQVTLSLKQKSRIIIDAIPALLVPVIVLGGIYGGVFTPTEAAGIAVLYGTLVSLFVYKEVNIKEFPKIAFNSMYICSTVLIIIGTSSGFGRILTIMQVPAAIADAILAITTNRVLILILINALLLLVGTFMETNASIIILVPILLPVVTRLGVNPVHFGIIMVLNLAIGFITPPLGANLFMACQISGIKFDDIIKAIVPWILVMIVVLALVVFIPDISLLLPRLMGLNVG